MSCTIGRVHIMCFFFTELDGSVTGKLFGEKDYLMWVIMCYTDFACTLSKQSKKLRELGFCIEQIWDLHCKEVHD